MVTESRWTSLDHPPFDPWKVEYSLSPEGNMIAHDLYRTQLRFKKGGAIEFIEKLLAATPEKPFFLSFYAPQTGMGMEARIHHYNFVDDPDPTFDHLEILVELTPDQVLALFPSDESFEFGY